MYMKTENVHDTFFREVFSVKENALDFLSGTLPPALKRELSLETMQLDSNSYTDSKLKTHFSDMVYTCSTKSGSSVRISLLFEHKSYKPKYPRLQLLRYMVNIWYSRLKQGEELQPVIPIVLYHGTAKWRKKRFRDYFRVGGSVFDRFIPAFDYILADLSEYTNEEIKDGMFNRSALIISLFLFKYIFKPKLLITYLKKFLELGKLYYREEEGLRFIESVFRYIFTAANIEHEKIITRAAELSNSMEDTAMTAADRLRKEGKEQGELLKEQQVLIRLVNKKFGLTEDEKDTIQSCNEPEKLDKALDTILTAESKDEVLCLLN